MDIKNTAFDLFLLLKQQYTNEYKSRKQFVEFVNNIIIQSEGSLLSTQLNMLLNDYCSKQGICSSCGKMTFIDHDENGNTYKVCKNCG